MISVIVPVYKVEPYLDRCVQSILNQTYKDFELLLVDDGSPDRCGRMCDEWAQRDARVQVIHKPNGGLSDARNAGIERAKGEYLCFVDSDDRIAEDMLEHLYQLLTDTNADMACGNFVRIAETGKQTHEIKHIREGVFSRDEFWKIFFTDWNRTYYTVIWNKIYKRQLFERLRFPVGKIHEDNYILYDLIDACRTIAFSDKIVYYYLQKSDGIMRSGRSVKNLAAPEAFLNMTEQFRGVEQWPYAAFSLDFAIRELLLKEFGENGKKSAEYKALKRRARRTCRSIWIHLPVPKKIRFFLFFTCPPLAILSEKWLTWKAHGIRAAFSR